MEYVARGGAFERHAYIVQVQCTVHVYACHCYMYSGIRVLAGSLASISAAGRLCEVSVCVLLSLDYRMYFYTEITYILYVTSVF